MTEQISLDEYATVAEAEQQRNALLDLLAMDPLNERPMAEVMQKILEHAPIDAAFSSNSIRKKLPPYVNTAHIGIAFRELLKHGYLKYAGEETSKKKNTHGKKVNKYKLADPARREVA